MVSHPRRLMLFVYITRRTHNLLYKFSLGSNDREDRDERRNYSRRRRGECRSVQLNQVTELLIDCLVLCRHPLG